MVGFQDPLVDALDLFCAAQLYNGSHGAPPCTYRHATVSLSTIIVLVRWTLVAESLAIVVRVNFYTLAAQEQPWQR